MADLTREIVQAVATARETGTPVYLRGGNSKRQLLGRQCDAGEVDLSGHRGIVDYQPGELYITARAGTPLQDIAMALAEQGQYLPCESPLLGGRATLGGTLASNLSGPGRPWWGSIRDLVIGLQLVNGRAELLRYGGKVVKNVAGYDVTRLQAGALGTLGAVTEVTVKVLPRPERCLTLVFELPRRAALALMHERAGQPKPLSGACWCEGRLYLRLAGAASAVSHTAALWGGEQLDDDTIWQDLGEMHHAFFSGDDPLWRISLHSTVDSPDEFGSPLIDWGGSQRWLRGNLDREALENWARDAGGHVCLFRGGDRRSEVRQQPAAVEIRLYERLKQAFDPRGLFNPGRLYSWL